MKNGKLLFFKRLKLEAELRELYKKRNEVDKKLDDLQRKCNHEILVTTPGYKSPEDFLLSEIPARTYCLLCRENLGPRKYIPDIDRERMEKAVKINLADYPNLSQEWIKRHMIKMEELYKLNRDEYPNATEYEIGEKIKKELNTVT